jgi:hypothetical protein
MFARGVMNGFSESSLKLHLSSLLILLLKVLLTPSVNIPLYCLTFTHVLTNSLV